MVKGACMYEVSNSSPEFVKMCLPIKKLMDILLSVS